MIKKNLLVIISVIFLISCTNPTVKDYDFDDPKKELPNVNAEMTISQILFDGKTLSFNLYLARPDLKLKETDYEKEMALTVDLPVELQPRLMYVSKPTETKFDYGSMCDRPRFPHRCEMEISSDNAGKNQEYMIKIVFEDNTYAEKLITVPAPQALPIPEITSPKTTPAQNSTFKMKFKDIGADKYQIAVRLCGPYGNDGINPCLEDDKYTLVKKSGKLEIENSSTSKNTPTIITDKEIVTIESDYPIVFEESIKYEIMATKSGEIGDKIPTIITSSDSIIFPES